MNESDLHEYQRESIRHIIENRFSALFLEMGLGKTVSTLTAIQYLMYEDLDITSALVIAPKRVAENVWTEEIEKWDHLKHLKVSLISGTPAQRRRALQQTADIYLLGRDNVKWLCDQYGGSVLPFDMLVLDELSSFKNPKSQRFKALRKVQPSFRRIVGLTGTPAPNGLIDLWGQIYLLDRGERLGKFVSHYRDEYFRPDKRNGDIVYSYKLKDGSEERIYSKIGDICMSMKAEDYLKLPGRIENNIEIKMPAEIQNKYDEFEEDQVMTLLEGDQTISAVNAAALSTKLLQFANGAVYDEDGGVHEVHDLKIETIKELIEGANGKPILIAWTFRHDRDRLMEALKKYKPRELKDRKDIADWNLGKIQIMLMHPASGGHGLNLQAGGHMIIWFGQTWSLELEQQFNARLDRQGQKNVVIINKLICSKTIDEDVIRAQKRKKSGQDGLMSAVKARINKYIEQICAPAEEEVNL
jgi:SNF2 family DNA or RNA helicase